MVRCTDEASRGTFVGKSTNTTYTSCAAMTGVNKNMTLAGGGSAISGLTSQTAAEIKGSNNHKAHPFDKALGPDYDLRAVINSEHWGDWPEADDDRKNIADCLIVLNPTEYEYSKSGYKLEDYLSITDGDNPPLVYGEDYTLEYQNANKVGDKATVIISGINDYYGAISKTFTITTKKLLQSDVYDENSNPDGNIVISIGYPAGSENGFEYSGAPNAPESTVTLGTDVLTEGIDYYLEYDPDNINIGTVNVTVVGHGNYEGRLENVGTFEIIGRNLADAEVTLLNATEEELVYDGNPKEPGVIVRINGKTLTRDVDYRVEFVCEEFKDDPDPDKRYNHTDVGTVIVLILPCEGNDQYSGQNDKTTFKITQATNVILLEPEISGWTWNSTPSALTRELTATFGSDTAVYSVHTSADCSESSRLVGPCSASELQDAMKILDAGNYYLYAVVAATDNWTEVSKIVPFTVDPWNFTDNVTIELAYTSVAYDGNPHEPDVTVKYNGDETLDVSNYTVSYDSDTTSVGTKTITITGKNNCIGTASATYEIIPVWTVTFDTAGGSLGDQENPVTVPDGQTVTEPQDPTYDGYRFDGWYWYINPSSFVPYDFDMSVDSDLTLYATWTRLWDVTFIPDNGEGNIVLHIPDQTSIGDSKPEDPERVGYDFDGWYEKDEYGNYINKWSDSAFNALITQEYELYAKWIPQEHTVTFDTNEGSVIAPVTLTYPDPLTQPDDPERDGYRFAGWYSDPELNTEFTGFGSSVPEDKTIYAKWIKQWEVTFKLYEGKDDIVLKVDTNTVMTKPSDPTRDNFDFDGWYTDPELKNKYTEEDWAKPVTESFTLYAKWKPKGT
jgi:uncharacterized repeat protein (TIGR02543 family)